MHKHWFVLFPWLLQPCSSGYMKNCSMKRCSLQVAYLLKQGTEKSKVDAQNTVLFFSICPVSIIFHQWRFFACYEKATLNKQTFLAKIFFCLWVLNKEKIIQLRTTFFSSSGIILWQSKNKIKLIILMNIKMMPYQHEEVQCSILPFKYWQT